MEKRWLAVVLILACTIFTSAAQIFYKFGALRLPEIVSNYPLMIGFVLYAAGAVILVTSMKFGEVTLVYPILATSYIWVCIMSWLLFSESMNMAKITGIIIIFIGVTIIALGSKKKDIIKYTEAI